MDNIGIESGYIWCFFFNEWHNYGKLDKEICLAKSNSVSWAVNHTDRNIWKDFGKFAESK